jgi:hypothetical protein
MDERNESQTPIQPAAVAASEKPSEPMVQTPPALTNVTSELPKIESPSVAASAMDLAPRQSAPPVEAPRAALKPAPAPRFLRDYIFRSLTPKPAKRLRVPIPAKKPPSNNKENPRSTRFALLAASVAIAACVGAGFGSFAASSVMQLLAGEHTPQRDAAEIRALRELMNQLGSDMGAVKAALDHSGKVANAQFSRIVDRLERAERLQADPAAKLTKALESLERLERRASVTPAAAVPQSDVTGSAARAAATEPAPKPPIIEGWVLRRVYDGVALVQGRRGVVEVEAGDMLNGAGRVHEIKRQDGRWVVVTSRGLIVPAR